MPPKKVATKTRIAKMALKRQITGKPPRLFKEINKLQGDQPESERLLTMSINARKEWRKERDIALSEGRGSSDYVESALRFSDAQRAAWDSHYDKVTLLNQVIKEQVTAMKPEYIVDYLDTYFSYNTGFVYEDMISKDIFPLEEN